jgi:soluble lytic murein transglycosylase-like protein
MKPGATSTPPQQAPIRRSAPGCMAASALLLGLLGLHAAPARADIWGYVDEKGVPHFSSFQVDERYEIFLREQSEPEPYRVQPFNRPAPTASTGTANAVAPETTPPPTRMKVYFEELPSYKSVQHLLREASTKHGIDYALLQALIATESGFNSRAVSPKGAVGLMQLIPPTAERYGVKAGKDATIEMKLTDPVVNIRAGSRYLSDLIKMFPGQIELALAAYNAGEGAVQRAGNKIPNYPETKNYVKTVMQLYGVLKPAAKGQTVITTGVAPGRVRVEMAGGSSGRGNMVPTTALPAASPRARAGRD